MVAAKILIFPIHIATNDPPSIIRLILVDRIGRIVSARCAEATTVIAYMEYCVSTWPCVCAVAPVFVLRDVCHVVSPFLMV